MTRSTPSPVHSHRTLLALTALLLGASLPPSSPAANADSPAPAQAPAATRYTTRAGDTLERIAQQQFKDSPLQQSIVVKVLQEHNQLLIGEPRPRQRLKTGLVLELPTHEQLARKVLMPYLQTEQAQSPAPNSPEQRKSWVRYP